MKRWTRSGSLLPAALAAVPFAAMVWFGSDAADARPAGSQAEPQIAEALGPAGVADYDRNLATEAVPVRAVTADQNEAMQSFLEANPNAVARFDAFSGSLDVLYGFASAPSAAGPETAARDFVAAHANLIGLSDPGALELDPLHTTEALGGYMLRFQQHVNGVPVIDAGVGVVMDGDKRVRAVSGPVYRDLSVNTSPSLTGAQAVQVAANDLGRYAAALPAEALEGLNTSYTLIEEQLGILTSPHPELAIYPTAAGARLAWRFFQYSRNPFGLFEYTVDAHTGEVLARQDLVRTSAAAAQDTIVEFTADVFPASPPITPALQDRGWLLDANGDTVGRPLGQVRVTLRKFDASNAITGTEDYLTGAHAFIQSALPTKQPFAQAGAGTFHFDQNELPLKGRTEEVDHLEEPAEHQDAISQFFYITSLIEYLDYLHVAGDAVHNRGVGEGDFPDTYPNSDTPLTGTVHIANVLDPPEDPTETDFVRKLLALDNAFAVSASTTIEGQEVVVNPTFYGHGYVFNNLAIDFAVPLHEGTHATITPIAGFEGSPEGGALNEGQADLWAYTIGENPTLGGYIANGFRLRDQLRSAGVDPDVFTWLRHGDSQLRYTQLGIRPGFGFEEHRDGEIYAGALWDLRQLMLEYRTGGGFARPNPISGEATDPITLGKETWERLLLGSMYVLGTMSPDNFVRSRDALLIADQVLYSSDPTNLDAPGLHWAAIERMYAGRSLGTNAAAPSGGRQTISTAVSEFTASQGDALAAPENVVAVPVTPEQVRVSWDAVEGAVAYEVLKKDRGTEAERLLEPGEVTFGNLPALNYFDGDAAFSGYTHVEYVYGDQSTSYVDAGEAFGSHGSLGLESPNFEYVVRAIGVNAGTGQIGFSDLSGTATVATANTDVSDNVDSRISNVSFGDGIFQFDQVLENTGGAGTFDGTIFEPLTFKILDISEPTVTVANADNGGTGQNGDEAHFVYDESLAAGETSAPRTLRFNDPEAKLFSFTAAVAGFVRVEPTPATGSQNPVDTSDPAERPETFEFTEEFTGLVVIGTTDPMVVDGVDYVDVPFTAKSSATSVNGTLSADPSVEFYPDLDFQLRDAAGNVLDTSGNFGPNEEVGAPLEPGEDYVYRVVGWANGPTPFRIVSTQEVTNPEDASQTVSGEPSTGAVTQLLEFTVDPNTGAVVMEILQ